MDHSLEERGGRDDSASGPERLDRFVSTASRGSVVSIASTNLRSGRSIHVGMLHSAIADFMAGTLAYPVWGIWGWYEVKKRYRRSVLGPFWVTISTGIFAVTLGLIYSQALGSSLDEYMPSVTIGVVLWGYISAVLTESCLAFVEGESLIRQTALPLTIHVFKVVWRNMIIMFHNFVVVALILLIYPHPINFSVFLLPLALLFYVAIGVSTGVTLALLCARFRDIPPIVASVVQVLFFVTPIMWQAGSIPGAQTLVQFNPIYYLIEVFRAPLMGQSAPAVAWLVVVALTVVTGGIALLLLARSRDRLVYWL